MLQAELLRLVLATGLVAGGAAAGVVALEEVHAAGAQTLAKLQALNDDQLLQAARTAYALDRGRTSPTAASEAVLVEHGYLSPAWALRTSVDTTPLALPEIDNEPAGTTP